MIRQYDQNMSPCVALETAHYLTDPHVLQEYIDLQQAHFGGLSVFRQAWKQPKFREFVLRLSRLTLFLIFIGSLISTISQMGRWNDIYFLIHSLV